MNDFLTVDDLLSVHGALSNAPVLDGSKLASACGRPSATFDGVHVHPTIWTQASALLHGIVQAHAFLDGNKRTAWAATVLFLRLNGIRLPRASDQSLVDYVVAVSLHEVDERATASWLWALFESGGPSRSSLER